MIKGAEFTKALAALGHDVEVLTSFPNYPTGKLYPGYNLSLHQHEFLDGTSIHRVWCYLSHDTSSIRRIFNYLTFFLSASIYATFFARAFDVIYTYPPITVSLAGAVAGFFRRKPYVVDIQDLWPDSVITTGMRGTKRLEGILSVLCNFAYRRAARIIPQSDGIRERLIERGVTSAKIDVIYNWADEQAAMASGRCDLSPYGFEGRFTFVYGGNLGRVQGLDTLVRAAHLARQRAPQIQLLLIGDGIESEKLKAQVKDLGVTNVRIEPGVPKTMIGDIFAAADVLVLHLWNNPLFEITIPQKTQFYMAMGKPVLVGVMGEAADFVIRAGAGRAVPPEDPEAMADAMVEMAGAPAEVLAQMGRNGRTAYLRDFSFASAIAATDQVLNKVVSSR
jgi:colanic acid biosynthesis glycosyl transferase WcaI